MIIYVSSSMLELILDDVCLFEFGVQKFCLRFEGYLILNCCWSDFLELNGFYYYDSIFFCIMIRCFLFGSIFKFDVFFFGVLLIKR